MSVSFRNSHNLGPAQPDDGNADGDAHGHREHLNAEQYYTCHDDVSTRRDVITGNTAR